VKRFEIVTEADARVIEYGSTITLASGGHVTPLALDTLRTRRVTIVRDGSDPDVSSLVPVARIARVAVAGDHSSVELKKSLVAYLRGRGLAVDDLGTHSESPVDYPNTAAAVGRAVARGEADAGIVIDSSGIGSAIAANKIEGIRAAMCPTPALARSAREHNGINVLSLGSTTTTGGDALAIVTAFLETAMREPRYIRRLALIRQLEARTR
jgi:ribose 5-phosphate isomerase B